MVREEEVRAAYRLLLGREPEDDAVVSSLACRMDSLHELRDLLMAGRDNSGEFSVKIGNHEVSRYWPVKGEPLKTFRSKIESGFFQKFMSGDVVVDVGFKGDKPDAVPILPYAIGVDFGFPGYDGRTLPFPDESVATLYSSHTLEHIEESSHVIRDWYRVTRVNGFIVCVVPHQYLYEKRYGLPSRWNPDHRRFYTPASLLQEFEEALGPNTYRIRHLCDNDEGYSYDTGPDDHARGAYEIELVIQKITPPAWGLAGRAT